MEDLGNFDPFFCVKTVRIRNFSGPYFPVFSIRTEYGKIPTRKIAYEHFVYIVFFSLRW